MEELKKVALIYDFDKTLISTNMQEGSFVEAFDISVKDFWDKANKISEYQECDNVLSGVLIPVILAKEKAIKYDKEFLKYHGRKLDNFFDGVEDWFDRINDYGLKCGLELEHYVISSGYQEMIESSKIASKLKKVFACKYLYDDNGEVLWPAIVVNYTQKTQYIARIQKGLIDNISDDKLINKKISESDIYIPYDRMVYFGDGETDVPSMRVIKSYGGHCVCVYNKNDKRSIGVAKQLKEDGRVDYSVEANYCENSELDKKVKRVLKNIK